MRSIVIAATWIAIAPTGAMAQLIAPGQRPTFTPPTIAPPTSAPLPSDNYKLSIVLPPKQGTSVPFVMHFPATLVHTGASVVVNLAGGAALQGTLTGNVITLRGGGPGGSTMTLALTTVSNGASGTAVIQASPTRQASGTSTLLRTPTGGPVSNLAGHGSDGTLCANTWTCVLRDYFNIIFGPLQ